MPSPVVFVPGMNCTPSLWEGVQSHVVRRTGRDVHHAPLRQRTLDSTVDDLLASLPERFVLAGLSLGGIVSMALVRQAPERVAGLALLSTNARPPVPDQFAAWERTVAELCDGKTPRQVQESLLPVLLSPAHRSDAIVEATLTMGAETSTQDLQAQLLTQTTRIDERPALARIGVPTLVLAGEADLLCPVDRHEEIAAAIPGAQLLILPGLGHLSTLEAPDLIGDALVTWLERVD